MHFQRRLEGSIGLCLLLKINRNIVNIGKRK